MHCTVVWAWTPVGFLNIFTDVPFDLADHRLNMEVDLQSLFGLHVTWCAQLYSLAEAPQPPPPHWDFYARALLVSQDRRHLVVAPCGRPNLSATLRVPEHEHSAAPAPADGQLRAHGPDRRPQVGPAEYRAFRRRSRRRHPLRTPHRRRLHPLSHGVARCCRG